MDMSLEVTSASAVNESLTERKATLPLNLGPPILRCPAVASACDSPVVQKS